MRVTQAHTYNGEGCLGGMGDLNLFFVRELHVVVEVLPPGTAKATSFPLGLWLISADEAPEVNKDVKSGCSQAWYKAGL